MPLYEFEHVIRLGARQKSALAKTVTDWHASSFKAPRFIVACRFIDVSQGPLSETFIGGESKKTNRLFISLRSGTGRTQEQLEAMTNKLVDIWTDIVGSTTEAQLRAVYIKGTLDSALEGGFFLPLPGKFEQWVQDNTEKFKELATAGDDDFIGLVKEIESRPEFQKNKQNS